MIRPRRPITPADVRGHYDDLDVFYREVWGEHVHHGLWLTGDEPAGVAVRRLVERVADEAGLKPGQTVCDIGCGYGATARQLAGERGARVTGLTISPVQHAYARSCTQGDNPTYLLRDWLANGLPDATFDAVVSIECLSHVGDKAAFFREAARVLRPGGRLVVCAWLAAEAPAPWQVRHVLEPICYEGRLPGLAASSEVLARIEEAGLQPAHFEDLSTRVRRTWTLILGGILNRVLTDRRYRAYLLDAHSKNRLFALTPVRLWLGYLTGALRYGLFTALR